jgi:hypothetical protein
MEDAVMVVAVGLIVPGDCGAGEEGNRHDENDASDDHNPRRGLVEPGTRRHVRRRSRVGGGRLDRGFWWFSHLLIMPRQGTPIKRCTHEVTVKYPPSRTTAPGAATTDPAGDLPS